MSATIKAAITALKGRIAAAYSAISAKGGTLPATQDSDNLASAIATIPSGGGVYYDGNVDVVGLRAIGWTDDDIAELRKNVWWRAVDDDLWKVPQELIDKYDAEGTWTATLSNTYRKSWWHIYMPRPANGKLDHEIGDTDVLAACPILTLAVNYTFTSCHSLKYIKCNGGQQATPFRGCESLNYIDFGGDEYATGTWWASPFSGTPMTRALEIRPIINMARTTNGNISLPANLVKIKIKNLNVPISIPSVYLTKESLLYIINNEAATTTRTITLSSTTYNRYSADSDIVAALTNHPKIALASA